MSFFFRIFFSQLLLFTCVCRRRRRCNSTWFTRCCDNYFKYSHLFLCFVLFFVFFLIATNFFRNINALNEIKKKNTTRFSIQQCRTRLSFFCYTFTTIDYHWLTLLFIPFPKICTENNTHTHSISQQRRSFFLRLHWGNIFSVSIVPFFSFLPLFLCCTTFNHCIENLPCFPYTF